MNRWNKDLLQSIGQIFVWKPIGYVETVVETLVVRLNV